MTRLVLLDQELRREVGATTRTVGAVVDVEQVENIGLPCKLGEHMILIMAFGNVIYYLLSIIIFYSFKYSQLGVNPVLN